MTDVTNPTLWRKSSYSSGGNGNCVEVGFGAAIGVRDTKDRAGGTLEFDRPAWTAFVHAVKGGWIGR